MTTVKVKYRKSKSPDTPGRIVYTVTRNKTVRQTSSGIRIYPNEWDEENARPRLSVSVRRTEYLRSIHRRIASDLKSLEEIITTISITKSDFSPDDIIREFCKIRGQIRLFTFMEGIIERFTRQQQVSTANNYKAAMGSFQRFRCGCDITLGEIDSTVMVDYQNFLKAAGLSLNSVSFYMRIIRAVYNRAVEEGITLDRRPFRAVFTGMEKTRKRAITSDDIKRIRNLDLSDNPYLEFSRNIFLFLFFCRGMSFIDAAYLKKTDINNGTLTYRRHKTGQQLHIKIISQICEILDRLPSCNSPYLLPIITRPDRNERRQYESALRRVNKALKIIGEMADLPKTLSTYVCRHSWATIAKTRNIPVHVISDALGHESVSTTQIYLASMDASVIDHANEIVVKDL